MLLPRTTIPALSTWGMIFMPSLLALFTLFKLHRRACLTKHVGRSKKLTLTGALLLRIRRP